MFCPSCGATNSTDQRFCRKCGLNLEAAASSLVEQFPAGERTDLVRREEMLERFGRFALGGFGIVGLLAVIGMIYVILTKMILSGQQPWAGVILIAFLISAVLVLTYVLFKEDLKERQRKVRPAPPLEFEKSAVTGKLLEESSFEPAPSVIEDTTELLPRRKESR
jgi:hypothetical protein